MHFTTSTLLTLLPLLSLTTASDVSTVSLFTYHATTTAAAGIPQFTSIPLGASIISANPTATTMAVSCLNDDNCILPSPITVTAGPSAYTLSAVYSTSVEGVQEVLTMVEDCKITGVTQGASCSVSYGIEATYKGVSTSTEVNTEISVASAEIGYETLSVTAGADKLSGATGTSTATASGSGSTETGMAGRNVVGAGALAVGVAVAGLGML